MRDRGDLHLLYELFRELVESRRGERRGLVDDLDGPRLKGLDGQIAVLLGGADDTTTFGEGRQARARSKPTPSRFGSRRSSGSRHRARARRSSRSASSPSRAIPTTSISGSAVKTSRTTFRAKAESSTTSTRMRRTGPVMPTAFDRRTSRRALRRSKIPKRKSDSRTRRRGANAVGSERVAEGHGRHLTDAALVAEVDEDVSADDRVDAPDLRDGARFDQVDVPPLDPLDEVRIDQDAPTRQRRGVAPHGMPMGNARRALPPNVPSRARLDSAHADVAGDDPPPDRGALGGRGSSRGSAAPRPWRTPPTRCAPAPGAPAPASRAGEHRRRPGAASASLSRKKYVS